MSIKKILKMIEDMRDTIRANDGVGFAAPQIGVSLQVLLFGFAARIVQHEFDHLQGILYPQRIQDFKYFSFTSDLPGDLVDDLNFYMNG